MKKTSPIAIVLRVIPFTFLVGCGSKMPALPILTQNQISNDRVPIDIPAETKDLKYWEVADANTFDRLERTLDVRMHTKKDGKLFGSSWSKESVNVNAYDEVADSTWFTNRNARQEMSLEEIEKGPTQVRLTPDGALQVISAKSSGVTPGFVVKDRNGNDFVLKFDPKVACGMPSAADVLGSRLLHAAGYNVPENNVEYINLDRLRLDEKARTAGKYGKKTRMTPEKFKEILDSIPECKQGEKTRVMASRFLSGKPIGPFSYSGTRKRDTNDRIPHEHRREIRGLSVMAAWINNTDFRGYNTLDMFQETENGKGYVLHNLIDFGAAFGSGSTGPKTNLASHEYWMDYPIIGLNTITFGFRVPDWENAEPSKYASIGNYRVEDFRPHKWKPTHPNPAMRSSTPRDHFWGARLVASFSDDQLKSAVEAAQFPEAGASEEMANRLGKRRDKIGSHWFSKTGGLDRFAISGEVPTAYFIDWLYKGPWAPTDQVSYRWDMKTKFGGKSLRRSGETSEKAIALFENADQWKRWSGEKEDPKSRYLCLRITPVSGKKKLAPWTEAYFYLADDGLLYWVGLRRDIW